MNNYDERLSIIELQLEALTSLLSIYDKQVLIDQITEIKNRGWEQRMGEDR